MFSPGSSSLIFRLSVASTSERYGANSIEVGHELLKLTDLVFAQVKGRIARKLGKVLGIPPLKALYLELETVEIVPVSLMDLELETVEIVPVYLWI